MRNIVNNVPEHDTQEQLDADVRDFVAAWGLDKIMARFLERQREITLRDSKPIRGVLDDAVDAYSKNTREAVREPSESVTEGDTREKLEADVRQILHSAYMLAWMHGNENRRGSSFEKLHVEFYNLLDRQASITERHWMEICGASANANVELKNQIDELNREVTHWKGEAKTQRNNYEQATGARAHWQRKYENVRKERDELQIRVDYLEERRCEWSDQNSLGDGCVLRKDKTVGKLKAAETTLRAENAELQRENDSLTELIRFMCVAKSKERVNDD